MTNKRIIYTYGTLLPPDGEYVSIPGKMYNLGWFPGVKLIDHSDGPWFKAKAIEATPSEIEKLDSYEGYFEDRPEQSLYIRTPIFEGTPLEGEIYVYNRPVSEENRIEHGDWLKFTGQSQGANAGLGMETA